MENPLKEEKIWYLKNLDILSGLSEEELKFLDENSVGLNLRRDELVYSPEEEEEFLYFLKRGSVKLYRIEPNGKEITLAILGPGDVFGGISPYEKGNYREFAKALEDTFICLINRDVFFSRMSRNPTVMLRFSRFLGLLTYELELRLEEVVSKPVISRVSSLLIRLYKKFGDGKSSITVPLSHKDIAGMVGTTREATTLSLNELKRAGAISLGRKRIKITDLDKLREFADEVL